eukprot:Skav227207  [mRNA]  locus=scaffold2048:261583:262197:+ [translate_table: standard]
MAHQRRWVGNLKARLDQGSLEQHFSGLAGCLVTLTCLDLGKEIDDHRVVWIDLQGLSASHHGKLLLVLESLGLHDLLLLGRVAELRSHHHDWRFREPLGDFDLLNLHTSLLHGTTLSEISQLLLPPVSQRLVHVLNLGESLLLLLGLIQLDICLLDGNELLALIIRKLLQAGLIQVIWQHQHFKILLQEDLQRRSLLHGLNGVT